MKRLGDKSVIAICGIIIVALLMLVMHICILQQEDRAYTNDEILSRAHYCHKQKKNVRMIYDEDMSVYAVLCVEVKP